MITTKPSLHFYYPNFIYVIEYIGTVWKKYIPFRTNITIKRIEKME